MRNDFWIKQQDEKQQANRQNNVNMLKEVEQEAVETDSAEILAAVKRGRDGEPFPKQKNLRGNSRNGNTMRIDNLITGPKSPIRSGKEVHWQKKKMNNGKKTAGANAIFGKVEQYDVLSGIA